MRPYRIEILLANINKEVIGLKLKKS